MSDANVLIRESGESRQAALNPTGTVIGRDEQCDIVVNSRDVSRRHANLFCNGAGQWTVEDLGSSNGTFVNGQGITTCPIYLDDVIEIGPASMSLGGVPEQTSVAHSPFEVSRLIMDDFGTEVFYDKPRLDQCDTRPCPKRLDQVQKCLADLSNLPQMYRHVCRVLAQDPQTAAAVIRVQEPPPSLTRTPTLLACDFGSRLTHMKHGRVEESLPSHRSFRVSHRLLEAVCVNEKPLMSKTIFSCDTQITLSLIDEHSPRALMCVSLGAVDQMMDLLYVDAPIDERSRPGPEEMFVFVQAVAKQIQHQAGEGA